jgi:hypothetical protein
MGCEVKFFCSFFLASISPGTKLLAQTLLSRPFLAGGVFFGKVFTTPRPELQHCEGLRATVLDSTLGGVCPNIESLKLAAAASLS